MTGTVVVALGGNALVGSGEAGTYREQCARARAMAEPDRRARSSGWRVVLVHGNGPQVGALGSCSRNRRGPWCPAQPLFSLVAMTQGDTGSLLTLALRERLGPQPPVVSMVTHTIVHGDDPAFTTPTKPIGPFLDEAEAGQLAARTGLDGGRRLRPGVATGRAVARAAGAAGVGDGEGAGGDRRGRHRQRRWWHPRRHDRAGLPRHRSGGRQGSGRGTTRLRSRCRRAGHRHRGPRRRRRLRHAGRAAPRGRARRGGRTASGGRAVRRREHGPEGRGGRPVRPPRRLDGRDHLRRPAAGHPVARCGAGAHRHPDPAGRASRPPPDEQRGGHSSSAASPTPTSTPCCCWPPPAAMQEVEGVTWATAVMATPANLEALEDQGVVGPELDRRRRQRPGAGRSSRRRGRGRPGPGRRGLGGAGRAVWRRSTRAGTSERGTWPWRLGSCRGPTSPSSRCPAPMPPSRPTRRSRPGWTCCCSATTFPSMRKSS